MPAVSEILADLQRSNDEPQEKVASSQPNKSGNINSAAQQLQESLQRLNGGEQTKQASAQQPADASAVAGLEKMASDLAQADEQRMLKEAQLYGAAVFDGFVSRANQYAQHASPRAKTASAPQSNGENVKLAAQLGYAEAENALSRIAQANAQAGAMNEKTAAEQEHAGVIAAMEKIAEATDDCFRRGYQQIGSIADALANG